MKGFRARFRAVFWSVAVIAALAALAFQAALTHRDNMALQARLRDLDARIRRGETEVRRLRQERRALESDPHRVELELRKRGALRDGEILVPREPK